MFTDGIIQSFNEMVTGELSTSTPTSRWKFSLRTLMLAVVIVCLAIPLVLQSIKLRNAEFQLRQLRDEVGYLSVDDRSKVHVIAVDMEEPNTWRWRLFLPQGARYSWCLGYGDIPAKGVPEPKLMSTSAEPYSEEDVEVVVTAKLRQMDDANWTFAVSSRIGDQRWQMGGAQATIPDEEMRRFREISIIEGSTLGTRGTMSLDPKGPIVLLQRRVHEKRADGSYGPSANPMPGYMLWLEKAP